MIDELILAIENNLTKLVISYFEKNKDFDLEIENNKLLRVSIEEGNEDIIDYLLSNGVKPERNNDSILANVADYGMLNLLKRLINMGLRPEFNNNEAIFSAIESGNIEVADYLYSFNAVKDNLMVDLDKYNGYSKALKVYVKRKEISVKLKDF